MHDNLPALEAVVEDFRSRDVDGIVGVGDYVLRGPFPQETMSLLRSLDARLIRGNTDGYVLDYAAGCAPDTWHVSDQWSALRWTREHVDDETLSYLASLPEQRVVELDGAEAVRLVHGRPDDPMGRLLPNDDSEALRWFRRAGFLGEASPLPDLDAAVGDVRERVVICGHTHIPWSQRTGGRLVLNPGAVSGSFNVDPKAHYALLSWTDGCWAVEHRAVEYDIDCLRSAFRETGYLDEGGALARVFLLTVETGKNVVGPFFAHVDSIAREAGCDTGSAVPDDVWNRAAATFSWPGGEA